MSLLGSLFKSSKKTDLSFKPPPSAESAPLYTPMKQLADNALSAANGAKNVPGIGFGEDYVNKNSNPIAQGWTNQYNQETAPRINSNFSSRGLGNSTLAANAQNQAYSNTQNNIDQMMAGFYNLNEQQKKSDISQGIGVGQNLNSAALNQGNLQSQASERLANATAAQNNYAQGVDTQKAMNLANTAGQGLSMFGSSAAGQGALNSLGLGQSVAQNPVQNIGGTQGASVGVNTGGSANQGGINALLQKITGGGGQAFQGALSSLFALL